MAEGQKKDLIKETEEIRNRDGNHQLEFTCEEAELKDLQVGDHLSVKHSQFWMSYYHHGIFLGPTEGVADFGGQAPSAMKVELVDLARFMKGSTLLRINYPTGTCLDPNATAALAREVVAQPDMWGEYDLLRNNCEHFAVRCKTGKAVSTQVLKQIEICLKNPIKRLVLRKSASLLEILGIR